MTSARILVFALLYMCTLAHAELGGKPIKPTPTLIGSSVSVPTTFTKPYSVQRFVTSDAVEINEYVSPNGLVFGVAWRGSSKPDLSVLLGAYFSRYLAALSRPASGRSPVFINDSDLVIQTGGVMNNFFGSAFLPLLAPSDVTILEIK